MGINNAPASHHDGAMPLYSSPPLSGLEIASLLRGRGGQRLFGVVDLVQHPLLKCQA